jgi:hypothetical protein
VCSADVFGRTGVLTIDTADSHRMVR